jgi:hypothetical protein
MKKNDIIRYGTGVVGLGIVLWLILIVWPLFWDFISHSKPEVGAAIIATSGTILVSVFTLAWTRWQERLKDIEQKRWEIEQEIRKQKLPIYEELVAFLFEIINTSSSGKPMPPDQLNKRMIYFTQKTVVWGSNTFLKDFSKFRDSSTLQVQSGSNQTVDYVPMMLNFENLLYSIRADFGHSNKGLGKADLLTLFVNDIHNYIPKRH